jgi:hypothetical protein
MLTRAGGEIDAMREWWSTRWYAPIFALAALLLVLLVAGLAVMEMLTAEAPSTVAPHAWTAPLDQADAALARGDAATAMSAWREAQAAALRSGHWEGMIAVGDASRRLAGTGRDRSDGLARARQAYLTALFRARRERSLDGLLSAAIAFGELGDRDVLGQALRIAEQQAGRDPLSRARVRTVADRWMSPPFEAEHRDPTLSGGHQP